MSRKYSKKLLPQYVCSCKGLCIPNPDGIAVYGYVIHAVRTQEWVNDGRGLIGVGRGMTTNRAEYGAIIQGLKAMVAMGLTQKVVEVCSDSQVCANQLKGDYKVKDPELLPYWKAAHDLAQSFPFVIFTWIPGKQNPSAGISRLAYQEKL